MRPIIGMGNTWYAFTSIQTWYQCFNIILSTYKIVVRAHVQTP